MSALCFLVMIPLQESSKMTKGTPGSLCLSKIRDTIPPIKGSLETN